MFYCRIMINLSVKGNDNKYRSLWADNCAELRCHLTVDGILEDAVPFECLMKAGARLLEATVDRFVIGSLHAAICRNICTPQPPPESQVNRVFSHEPFAVIGFCAHHADQSVVRTRSNCRWFLWAAPFESPSWVRMSGADVSLRCVSASGGCLRTCGFRTWTLCCFYIGQSCGDLWSFIAISVIPGSARSRVQIQIILDR